MLPFWCVVWDFRFFTFRCQLHVGVEAAFYAPKPPVVRPLSHYVRFCRPGPIVGDGQWGVVSRLLGFAQQRLSGKRHGSVGRFTVSLDLEPVELHS